MKNKAPTQQQAQKLAWETAFVNGTMTPNAAIYNSLLRAAGRK